MCGIAGVLKLDGTHVDGGTGHLLRGMVREIGYRGPDDEQVLADGPVGLAFRRLSIVDLAGGRQPLRNEDGSILLIANGEIYNHRDLRRSLRRRHQFRTASDCEVILHLYEEKGISFLDALVGMYALAIWDRREQKLILARDRFGIKPLFYTQNRERLVFASEIKALLQYPDCPRQFDWECALTDPWLSGSVSTNPTGPVSFFKGIEHLPGGAYLEADLRRGRVQCRRYWTPPKAEDANFDLENVRDQDLVEQYAGLLADAVRNCLMSDVEIGLFLSGGIDSAAIAALAAREKSMHSFSVLSLSTVSNEDAKFAHAAATVLGLPNHQVIFRWDANQTTAAEWKRLLWLCETPLCGAEQLYKYHLHRYARSVRPGLKVILTGQGSDEFNGGYSQMFAPPEEQSWAGFLSSLAMLERGRLLQNAPVPLLTWEHRFQHTVLRGEFLQSMSSERAIESTWHAYAATKYRDLQMYNCWHEDRTASGNSIENRVPFLDHRLVEFTMRLPPGKRQTLLWNKRILRQAMKPYLPQVMCDRPKVAFFVGDDARYTYRMMLAMLMGDDGELIEEAFAGGCADGIVDAAAVRRVIEDIANDPEADDLDYVLRLVNMGLLDQMATRMMPSPITENSAPIMDALLLDDWDGSADVIQLQLSRRQQILEDSAVIAMAATVSLARRADSNGDDEYYLLVGGRIHYVLAEPDIRPWIEVLRRIDGYRSLGEIFLDAHVTEPQVRKYLSEALDFGLVIVAEVDDDTEQ